MKDCFNWDQDTVLNRTEYYLKKKRPVCNFCAFTVRHSDKWNIYDMRTCLEDAGYHTFYSEEKEKVYVALNKENLAECKK